MDFFLSILSTPHITSPFARKQGNLSEEVKDFYQSCMYVVTYGAFVSA